MVQDPGGLFFALYVGIDERLPYNTDDGFRHFLLNTTNQTQLSSFISQTADHILATFPIVLTADVGLFVANPADGSDAIYSANFTNDDYHGTLVWGWQLIMMAKDEALHSKVLSAYNRLWDVIKDNRSILGNEVWSWKYGDGEGFVTVPLGDYNPTESNIRQLWSLTFLTVKRNEALKRYFVFVATQNKSSSGFPLEQPVLEARDRGGEREVLRIASQRRLAPAVYAIMPNKVERLESICVWVVYLEEEEGECEEEEGELDEEDDEEDE
ncbi:uncharacterized protein J7T54_005586 [Emericellopsis cladophorae]|uniref:Uncharacterized protein n=1 Tax=Emericellopsis cladophorae TaxID=2686198 RepID=A0A9Q0BF37_9HYPO|nr:uncharacterized protein J7T54_005586 [Emericellopsis cladophorae]KAI6783557.1 hypothetical protein J7T54_005586 [Emericellopsis cladophorae]